MTRRAPGRPATLRFIFTLAGFHRIRYGTAAFGWMTFHLWPLLPGLLGKLLFDALQGHTSAGLNVTTIVAIAMSAGLARSVAIFGATVAVAGWHVRAQGLVQRNLLARLLELPGAQAFPGSLGEVVSTFRDDAEAMSRMGDWGFDSLSAGIFAGGGIAILAAINARITVLVMVPILVVIALTHTVRAKATRLRERSRAETARVTGTIGEIATAVRTIQAAGKEAAVLAHLRAQSEVRKHAMVRDKVQSLTLDSVFNGTASIGTGLVLLLTAGMMRQGQFSVGDFVLFSTYLMQVAQYTGFMGYLIRVYQQVSISISRMATLFQGAPAVDVVRHHPLYLADGPPPIPAPPPADRLTVLEVRGLSCVHASGRGVRDVSLRIPRGTIVVVTGRIGSGKTTLLRSVLGLLPTQAGEIRWNGGLVDAPGDFLVPPRVAYTPQSPSLLSGSLRENILLGLPDDERLTAAVHHAVLEDDVARLADGLDTEIGVRGVRLSGGQVQRTAAARMFAHGAELLVLDDLSSALDVETERELWRRLFRSEVTCLAVSHRPAVLERADRIVVLSDGVVAAEGTLPELLDGSAEMRALYASGTETPVSPTP